MLDFTIDGYLSFAREPTHDDPTLDNRRVSARRDRHPRLPNPDNVSNRERDRHVRGVSDVLGARPSRVNRPGETTTRPPGFFRTFRPRTVEQSSSYVECRDCGTTLPTTAATKSWVGVSRHDPVPREKPTNPGTPTDRASVLTSRPRLPKWRRVRRGGTLVDAGLGRSSSVVQILTT